MHAKAAKNLVKIENRQKLAAGVTKHQNTLIYTQLIEFEAQDRYHVKVAKTLKDTCNLLEAGYEV